MNPGFLEVSTHEGAMPKSPCLLMPPTPSGHQKSHDLAAETADAAGAPLGVGWLGLLCLPGDTARRLGGEAGERGAMLLVRDGFVVQQKSG